MSALCTARIRPFSGSQILDCRRPDDGHRRHLADGLIAGQTITWFEDDRRTFRGDFVLCVEMVDGEPARRCILPAGHSGRHAP